MLDSTDNDLNKLANTVGGMTVDLESFEGNNLARVDEGHRGSWSSSVPCRESSAQSC